MCLAIAQCVRGVLQRVFKAAGSTAGIYKRKPQQESLCTFSVFSCEALPVRSLVVLPGSWLSIRLLSCKRS